MRFIGIDIGAERHSVAIVDEGGRVATTHVVIHKVVPRVLPVARSGGDHVHAVGGMYPVIAVAGIDAEANASSESDVSIAPCAEGKSIYEAASIFATPRA